jgi:hemoglobin-like flavoprotein
MDIQESLHRLLQSKESFGVQFYKVFFDRCPEARAYFAGINMDYQAALLTMALKILEAYYIRSYPAMATYLKYLGHKHHSRAIPPDLYPRWRDALLDTLERFHGPDWDDKAALQWREAFERAREAMSQGYGEAVHV